MLESEPRPVQISCERALINSLLWVRQKVEDRSWGNQEEIHSQSLQHLSSCPKRLCTNLASLISSVRTLDFNLSQNTSYGLRHTLRLQQIENELSNNINQENLAL